MINIEWVMWIVIGLVLGGRIGLTAGGLTTVLQPEHAPGRALWAVLFGVLSALFGGWVWVVALGDGPGSCLGAAVCGLLGAMAVQFILSYHVRRDLHI
jgi:hypothetical protein